MRIFFLLILTILGSSGFVHAQRWELLNDSLLNSYYNGDFETMQLMGPAALDAAKAEFGEESSEYAISLNNFAFMLYQMGKYPDALPLYERALDLETKLLGRDHPDVALTLSNLGSLLMALDRHNEAEPYLKNAVDVYKISSGEKDQGYLQAMNNLGMLYINTRRVNEAKDVFLRLVEVAPEAIGNESPDYGAYLNNLAFTYNKLNNYPEAEKYYKMSRDVRKKALGEKHPDYAVSLNNLATLYTSMGKLVEAQEIYRELIYQTEATLGKKHPNYSTYLNNLASLEQDLGRLDKAIPRYREVERLRREAVGEENSDYAVALGNLANALEENGDLEESELLFQRALAIKKKVFGKDHPSYAATLNNLAFLNKKLGKFERSEKLFLEALSSFRKLEGAESKNYATTLNNLGMLYQEWQRYEKAEEYYESARKIRKRVLGNGHPDYASSLNNLGALYREIGNYEAAEPYYEQALKIRLELLGLNHPSYANSLENLAILYMALGNYDEAEPLLKDAKRVYAKTYGTSHSSYAVALNNLAHLYQESGKYDLSIQMYEEALTIRKDIYGVKHREYGHGLRNLGVVLFKSGALEQAEFKFREALEIHAIHPGKQSTDYAFDLMNLASVLEKDNNFADAENLYKDAYEIRKKVLGKAHPDLIASLNSLTRIYLQLGKIDQAVESLDEAQDIFRKKIGTTFHFMSEQEKLVFLNDREFQVDLFHSVTFQSKKNEQIASSYDQALFFKSLLLRSSRVMRDAIASGGDQQMKDAYQQWESVRSHLGELYSRPVEEHFTDIDSLERLANLLEKQLVRGTAAFADYKQSMDPSWEMVQSQLQEDEAAIEFIRFRYFETQWTSSVIYAALVLRPEEESPKWVSLFEESAFKNALNETEIEEGEVIFRGVYAKDPASMINEKLYKLIWSKLEKHLEGVKTIWYSPDGLLYNVSLDALPMDEGFVCDKYELNQVTTTADIRKEGRREKIQPGMRPAIYGGIKYDGNDGKKQVPEQGVRSTGNIWFRKRKDVSLDKWDYLPGSAWEAEAIVAMLNGAGYKPRAFRELEATEESVKYFDLDAPPEILHFATHGFYLPPRPSNDSEDDKRQPNPLLRSGLVLSGANSAWQGKELPQGVEDGILTAYEVANLDLSKTKLVVLSACETGLGDVKGMEGVYGLRRGFKLAGVDYMVSTLWPVPDRETAEFMQKFYKGLLEGKEIRKAFRDAQNAQKNNHLPPWYWAGFVITR